MEQHRGGAGRVERGGAEGGEKAGGKERALGERTVYIGRKGKFMCMRGVFLCTWGACLNLQRCAHASGY